MPANEQYDTPHPTTVKVGHKEHCWNNRSPREDGYYAQSGWERLQSRPWGHVSTAQRVWVKDTMSQPCGQRKGMAPPGCEGCEHLGT